MGCMNAPVPPPGAFAVGSVPKHGTILASASRDTGAHNSGEMFNACWLGVRLFVNTTAVGASGTVVVKVQNKNPLTGDWVDIPDATTGSIATNTTTVLDVYPGIDEDANAQISSNLGKSWRIVATVGTNAVTFSVSGEYLA